MAEAKHMTRRVAIGKLKSYEYKTEPYQVGKGQLDIGGGQNIQFTIWNKANGDKPHTKAADFEQEFKEGDLVFVTGSDNRSYSEAKDRYYEDIQVWDYRAAEENEIKRDVFVYVGDIKEITDEVVTIAFINYKDEEMLFPLLISDKTKITGDLEIGARIKVKGQTFNGFKMDFFGEGEYVTERNAVDIIVLHTAEELNVEGEEQQSDGSLWD